MQKQKINSKIVARPANSKADNFKVNVPADVPKSKQAEYKKNYLAATHGKGRLSLFAGDQKIEHLNDDFVGPEVSPESANPIHLFEIAAKANIYCFATQLGMIARYGRDFPKIPYVVKLNSKSNLVKTSLKDPLSLAFNTIEQVVRFKKSSSLNIVGVGYTLYLGSEFESEMMREAASLIFEAHQQGFFTVIWMYPRGKSVANERDPHLIAGATGVACALGTDFVKINYPKLADSSDATKRAQSLKEAIAAAGRTKVICSGGEKMEVRAFLQQLHDQIHISGASGNATGRNIHERSLDEAVRFANAIYSITMNNASVDEALKIFNAK
jgi:fructose-bisphosphate aldolase/6-deoxy-5-ketofructose 1-phosphate synthase